MRLSVAILTFAGLTVSAAESGLSAEDTKRTPEEIRRQTEVYRGHSPMQYKALSLRNSSCPRLTTNDPLKILSSSSITL